MIIREFRDDSRKYGLWVDKNGKLVSKYAEGLNVVGVYASGTAGDIIMFRWKTIEKV